MRQQILDRQALDTLRNYFQPLGAGGTWIAFADWLLAGPAGFVTFNNVPQTYDHLVFISEYRTDRVHESDAMLARFNGDATNAYDYCYGNFRGDNVQISGCGRAVSAINISAGHGSLARANNFGLGFLYIPSYRRVDREKWLAQATGARFGNRATNNDMFISIQGGAWRSQNAIVSVTLLPNTGPNFVAGTRFTGFGVIA